jgi:hypothetical protein
MTEHWVSYVSKNLESGTAVVIDVSLWQEMWMMNGVCAVGTVLGGQTLTTFGATRFRLLTFPLTPPASLVSIPLRPVTRLRLSLCSWQPRTRDF